MALSSLLSTKFLLPGVASVGGKPGKFQRIAISQVRSILNDGMHGYTISLQQPIV
jgi:hypothetical protein